MAFVRFGVDGSQIYIYERSGDLKKQCCGCALSERLPDLTDEELAALPPGLNPEHWRARWAEDFATNDLDAMLAHVAEHRAAGHHVPDWVEQVLRDEWDEE